MSPRNSETENDFYRASSSQGSARSVKGRGRDEGDSLSIDDGIDDRFIDLETNDDAAFLRAQRRVPVRRGALPKSTANRLKLALAVASLLSVLGVITLVLYFYGTGSWRFRIESSDNIAITGVQNVPRAQVMEIFGADIGRNIFFVSLDERKKQLEEISWVESASVMRLLPNRLKVRIRERMPVAFARIGPKASLVDANGVVLEMPARAAKKYSFPVIIGMEDSEPLSTRAARMKIFMNLVQQLDSGGAGYTEGVSEVDLSDPDDAKITVADENGAVLVHLGVSEPGEMAFLERYKVYLAHVQEWRTQVKQLESVDLRYDRQVIVNPDSAKSHSRTRDGSSPPLKPAARSRPASRTRATR